MTKKIYFSVLLMLSHVMAVVAQTTFSGTVIDDSNGEPIIGASVVAKDNKSIGCAYREQTTKRYITLPDSFRVV